MKDQKKQINFVREDESLRGKPCPWLFPLILILSFLLLLHIAWQCSLHSCWWIRQTKSLFISIHFVVTLCLCISLCRTLSVLEFLFLNYQLFSLPFWTNLFGNLRILLHSFVLHIVYRFIDRFIIAASRFVSLSPFHSPVFAIPRFSFVFSLSSFSFCLCQI